MKKLSLIALGLLIIVHLAVPMYMIRDRENTLRNGERFKFKTRPIDPADPFQGRYVLLGYKDAYIPWPEDKDPDLEYKARIYVNIEIGADGFARFTDWSLTEPDSGNYLASRYLGRDWRWNPETRSNDYKGLRIKIPFDRFYMDEAKAPRAEILARDAARTTNCWAEVRIREGKAVIEDVYAEGQSLRVLAAEKE
jgi:uncharacterized membrane-anchored protein